MGLKQDLETINTKTKEILNECNEHLTYPAANMQELPMLIDVAVNGARYEGEQSGYKIGYDVGYGNASAQLLPNCNAVVEKYTTPAVDVGELPAKIEEVYEAGKAAGGGGDNYYDEFWDSFQDKGNRTNYQYGFAGYGWNKATFNPKYSVFPEQMSTMFWQFGRTDTDVETATDFVEVFENRGLVFDTSNCTNFTSAFMWANIKRLGVIDMRKCQYTASTTFGYGKIKTIEKLIVDEDTPFQANTFQSQAALENITVEGVIGYDGLNLQWSTNLTHDSLMSIIGALKDLTGTGKTYTLTIGATNYAKLTYDEVLVAQNKGWTVK